MHPSISIVIPAWNEETYITETLLALQDEQWAKYRPEIIVVDDGSKDATFRLASRWIDRVIRHPRNRGKGYAMQTGWLASSGQIVVFLDADLGTSARHAWKLVEAIVTGDADMTIAVFPRVQGKGGFGFVKRLASNGIYWLSGYRPVAPLSGQRAVRRQVLRQIGDLRHDFGIEVGLTIDTIRRGYTIKEIEIPLKHRETGRNWIGLTHRGKQFVQVFKTLWRKWKEAL